MWFYRRVIYSLILLQGAPLYNHSTIYLNILPPVGVGADSSVGPSCVRLCLWFLSVCGSMGYLVEVIECNGKNHIQRVYPQEIPSLASLTSPET